MTQAEARLLDLDDPRCADPVVAGGKGAWLAKGRAAGLPLLPGLVIPVSASAGAMRIGADALARRGSGGARLEVSAAPLPAEVANEVVEASARLASTVVVRSSSPLEGSGAWSGAFSSYLDVAPEEVPTAVAGCWASAFTPATLARFAAAGVEPGSVGMAVVVQPCLHPEFGGTARVEGQEVVVNAVAGSPAPLVQGWEPGEQVRVSPDGAGRGAGVDLLGADVLSELAATVRQIEGVGANACEWAVARGKVVILQLLRSRAEPSGGAVSLPGGLVGERALAVARLVRRYPGPMGEALVLPWALAAPDLAAVEPEPVSMSPPAALAAARAEAATLTAQVWALAEAEAAAAASATMRELRGPDPGRGLETIAGLRPPPADGVARVLAALATVRRGLVEAGIVVWPDVAWYIDPAETEARLEQREPARLRVGVDRWEPFGAAVTMANSAPGLGTPSAPGIGHGRLRWLGRPADLANFRPRDVIVAPLPTQPLASLLWDAAGLVTVGGSPAAHLFESARALGLPAVSSIRLDELLGTNPASADGRFALTVDGNTGGVFATAW